MTALSKLERVQRTLAGKDVDRPPYSFWTHFPRCDMNPTEIVSVTVELACRLDLDFVKAMSNGLYALEDWGVRGDFSDVATGGVARVAASPIQSPQDWRKISPRDTTAPALARELRHIGGLIDTFNSELPVLATVFSPLTVAHKLAGNALAHDIALYPDYVLAALEAIALTQSAFARAAINAGAAGVFFAVQDADPKRFSAEQYARFGTPFDLAVLAGAEAGWFNTVHMHGDSVMFDVLKAYPVPVLNWHIGETAPTLAAYRQAGGSKAILGGLRRAALTHSDAAGVEADIASAFSTQGARGLLFGPGCVIRHPIDRNFLARVAARIRGESRQV